MARQLRKSQQTLELKKARWRTASARYDIKGKPQLRQEVEDEDEGQISVSIGQDIDSTES